MVSPLRLLTLSLLGFAACVDDPVFVAAGGGGGGGGTSVVTTTASSSSATTSSSSASSTSTGTRETCGNGAIDAGEECDDGNSSNDDGCSAECKVECSCTTCFKGTQRQPVCYQFGDALGSRSLGAAACAAWCPGCELAQVHDEAELAAINNGLQALGTQGEGRIWVGGLRVTTDSFAWADGTPLPSDSSLWFKMGGTCPVEPTNLDPSENGVILWDCPDDEAGFSYKLADHNEAEEHPYLCEMRPPGSD